MTERPKFVTPIGRPSIRKKPTAPTPDMFTGVRPPKGPKTGYYDPECTQCPRLAEFLTETHKTYPDYFARPVPAFGAAAPKILIVGFVSGMHGANRTGRPFTGDYAGVLLYETLHELGLATQPTSVTAAEPMTLVTAHIDNTVK